MITIPGTVQGMLFVFWHGFKQWSGDTIEALNIVWIACARLHLSQSVRKDKLRKAAQLALCVCGGAVRVFTGIFLQIDYL